MLVECTIIFLSSRQKHALFQYRKEDYHAKFPGIYEIRQIQFQDYEVYAWQGDTNWNYGFFRIKHNLSCQLTLKADYEMYLHYLDAASVDCKPNAYKTVSST